MGILELFNNDVLIAAVASWLIAQIAKIIVNAIVTKKFDIKRLTGDGGMPSGHSAFVTSAALMTGLVADKGFADPTFGIALIIAIVVMHDATGVRQETGKQAVSIIEIVDIMNEYLEYLSEHDKRIKIQKLKTLVGHTHLQVFFGALTGVAVVILYLLIFGKFDLVLNLFS